MRKMAAVCLLAMAIGLAHAEPAMDARLQEVDPILRRLEPTRGQYLNVPREHGRFLRMLVEMTGRKRALEIGTSNGYSAIWIGLGLEKTSGKLETVEIVPETSAMAKANLAEAKLDRTVTCTVGDALEVLPRLEGTFDFVFIDALKEDYWRYYELVRPKLRPGAVIAAHNALSAREAMSKYFELLDADPNLQTTIVQIEPGDGFAVSFVREKPQSP
ncbi:MAG: O-methyltransferase [Armatimonadetes bacterium]|nr:O-methyltransferase [Armatimonadota bacterium]